MIIEFTFIISFFLLLVATFLTLRLIKITGVRSAWVLIALGLMSMAVEMVLPLLPIKNRINIVILNDWIPIVTSILIVAGLSLVAPLFYSIRRSEKAIRKSERSYRTLVQYIDVGLFRSTDNLHGHFLQANPAIAKMLGYESFNEFMHVPLVEHFKNRGDGEGFIEKVKASTYVKNEEIELQKKDGSSITASITASAQYDRYGQIKWINGVIEDITERKRVELQLRESEELLNRVIQSSPIPIFVIGRDHRVIYWNRALEELTGIKADEAVGTNEQWKSFYRKQRPCLADLLVDEALEDIPQWYPEKYIKSRLLEEAYEVTDFFADIGKGGKWLRLTAASIRDSQGELVGAIETLEDITERRQAEEELIKIRKLESLGIFASGIAHDFNNLLSLILRNIFAAKLSLADAEELPEQKLELAEKVGFQAKELAHRLIIFAKGGEPMRKVGSLSQLLINSVDLSLADSNVQCQFSLPDDLWPVEMDDVQIRQVIHNLVTHAREAMPDGGTISIGAENMHLSAQSNFPLKEGNYVKWWIKDHGAGIPKEDLQKIFDPYFSTKPSGSSRGMELGLAICYAIINRHEGYITVESQPGVGSSFFIYLSASPQESDVARARIHPDGRKILVMHHDESVRQATGIVLNFLGYTVESVKDAVEAIDRYGKALEKNQAFSAVILDMDTSGDQGARHTIKALRAIDPQVYAILSSGYKDGPTASEFEKLGFKDLVAVPYDMDKMKDILNRVF